MNVADILDRVIELSVGGDSADNEEQLSFLNYLNMAGEELYRATASLDDAREVTKIQVDFVESAPVQILDDEENPIP